MRKRRGSKVLYMARQGGRPALCQGSVCRPEGPAVAGVIARLTRTGFSVGVARVRRCALYPWGHTESRV